MKPLHIYYLRSEAVQAAVELHHYTQREIAESLQISKSYWSQLCTRQRRVTPKVRRRLLKLQVFQHLKETELWDRIKNVPNAAPERAPRAGGTSC